ncbi:hypothetical protein C8R47DRAFT_1328622 [Mycena vitilis]|nr:hypothetical protein C8R47DRAFT_1328622 [Mycena vitilis]
MRFFDLGMGPHDVLFAQIPTLELVRLMRACRRVCHLIKETCFNLSRLLAPFFGDATQVQRFRSIQALTDTLVSGSVALQYFNRLRWPDSDLDMYIHRTCPVVPVDFLVRNGYTFDPRKSQNKDVFVQLTTSGDKKIQVIIAESTPMETIISFHTSASCVHSSLLSSKACTFVTREALVVETVGAGQEIGRQKYIDRGWTMTRVPSLDDQSEPAVRMVRWVGDRYPWTISLPPLPVETTDLCTTNSYQLCYSAGTTRTTWGLLDHPALEYKYIVGDLGTVAAVSEDVSLSQSNADVEFCKTVTRSREKAVKEGYVVW